jgi:hypothetical protein
MAMEPNWQKMKARALEATSHGSGIGVRELDEIVDIACADGDLDEREKAVLIDIIAGLTLADMSDALWTRVEELIEKYDLHNDSEATIEGLEDEATNHY